MIELRKTPPKKDEFDGVFPKRILCLAIVGISCSNGETISPHWRIAEYFHIDSCYEIGFNGGINKHGTPYECFGWHKLEDVDKYIGKGS